MPVVKKTVVIHPLIDGYVRRTWAFLIEQGYNATYSTALNFMLLGAIFEALKEGGWDKRTRKLVYDFLKDEKTIEEINREDMLLNILEGILLKIAGKDESSGKR